MRPSAIKIAASILAADFARLSEQVVQAEHCGADRIHVDVMDGHFVPNNPATPAAMLEEILHDVDQVLVMTVNPGFGQQHFLRSTLGKIHRVRQMIEQVNPACDLEVDGGIDEETAPQALAAGANVLVAGTAVFRDPLEWMQP
jgi:pentose-5-phosphate-3-epimerase